MGPFGIRGGVKLACCAAASGVSALHVVAFEAMGSLPSRVGVSSDLAFRQLRSALTSGHAFAMLKRLACLMQLHAMERLLRLLHLHLHLRPACRTGPIYSRQWKAACYCLLVEGMAIRTHA